VEKLCQRFSSTTEPRQWRDIAFCLSLLPFNSDAAVKKLTEGELLLSLPTHSMRTHPAPLTRRATSLSRQVTRRDCLQAIWRDPHQGELSFNIALWCYSSFVSFSSLSDSITNEQDLENGWRIERIRIDSREPSCEGYRRQRDCSQGTEES